MKDINEWEVLTPDGWRDFSGIVEYEKPVLTIELENGSFLTASESHRIVTDCGMMGMDSLSVGDSVFHKDKFVKIINITELKDSQKVYDLVEVESVGHRYFTNDFVSHNCDEMAFIPNRVQSEFMAGTAPALSATKGKMIISSTPNGSRDLFAKIWFGTGMEWDKSEYTYVRKNQSKNDFAPLFVPYWIDDSKNNEEWINREKRTLDDPTKWRIEFDCLEADTEVEVYDTINEVIKVMKVSEIYAQLNKDFLDEMVILENGEIDD